MKQFSDVNIEFSLRLNSTTEELYISRSQHSSDTFAIHICKVYYQELGWMN